MWHIAAYGHMLLCMRTTLDINTRLLKAARQRAIEKGKTLTSVVEDALGLYLRPAQRGRQRFKLDLLIKKGRLLPGVDLADRDSLYERMEDRT
jgi:hypothetical protein